jgi:hypothetical protein
MAKAKTRTTTNRTPRHLTLSPAQIEALEEMCTLSPPPHRRRVFLFASESPMAGQRPLI